MKDKKLLIVFILMAIVSGLSILIAERQLNKKLQQSYKDIAEQHKILVENTTKTEDESTTESLDVGSVEYINSNQIAAKVGSYVDVLECKKYDLLCYIYPDLKEESLTYGAGWYKQSKWIGEKGVCAVAGHSSSVYNCIMNSIKSIKVMETFNVYDDMGTKHTYFVTGVYEVPATATSELVTTDDTYSIFKIITCTNNGNDRLVIEGTEFTEVEAKKYMKEYKEVKQQKLVNLLGTMPELHILDNFYTREGQEITGYWHYIRQNDDWGFNSLKYRGKYQTLTNNNKDVKKEVKKYDLSKFEN